MRKKSFSIHSDYYNEIENLSLEQQGALFVALIRWADRGEPSELDPMSAMLFRLIIAKQEEE